MPACSRCVKAGHAEDCEYQTEDGLTTSQLLEDNIAKLEARIRELEQPAAPVSLQEPYVLPSLETQPIMPASLAENHEARVAVPAAPKQDFWEVFDLPSHISRQL
jgi:hypothetical protein